MLTHRMAIWRKTHQCGRIIMSEKANECETLRYSLNRILARLRADGRDLFQYPHLGTGLGECPEPVFPQPLVYLADLGCLWNSSCIVFHSTLPPLCPEYNHRSYRC